MEASVFERFAGIDRLYGRGAVEWLAARRVAVVGLGGVGLASVLGALASGASPVVAVDLSEDKLAKTNRMKSTSRLRTGQILRY